MTVTPSPAELLPHVDPMVLLDRVTAWNDCEIRCEADSHRRPDHPLTSNGELSIFCGLEYAAQAMAAHNRLTADQSSKPRKGFLATASKVRAHAARLDEVTATLNIRATRIVSSGGSSLYEFELSAGGRTLLDGQLMVVQESEAL